MGPTIAITEQCGYKEAAWEFLRYVLTYEYQTSDEMLSDPDAGEGDYCFPTRVDALETVLEKAGYSKKEKKQCYDLIERLQWRCVDRGYRESASEMQESVMNIIMNEAEKYDKGKITLKRATRNIQNKVEVYAGKFREAYLPADDDYAVKPGYCINLDGEGYANGHMEKEE